MLHTVPLMSRLPALLTALTLVAGMTAVAHADQKGATYRWVDEQGVVHYGDSIPPQYAQQAATVINKQGMTVGHVDAPRTEAQLAQQAAAAAQAAQQKQHDAFLLATYTSPRDIESLRDERLTQLRGQQAATQKYIDTLSERLSALTARAQNFKPYSPRPDARRMPDDLAEQIVHTTNDIRTQREALVTSQTDESNVRQQFQADIDRYKELRPTPPGH